MKILILLLLTGLFAIAKTDVKANPYFIPGMNIKKFEFLKFLKEESPKDFCEEKGFFIKCFDVVESRCPVEVKQSFDLCATKTKIPDEFDVLEIDSVSKLLGECIGKDIEKKWSERKRGTRECKNRF